MSLDLAVLGKKAISYILPFIGKSKAIAEITKQLGEATNNEVLILWDKYIKAWFIEEFEENETLSDDAKNVAIVEREMKKQLQKESPESIQELQALLEKLEAAHKEGKVQKANTQNVNGDNNIVIQDVRNNNINTGDVNTNGGDFRIGNG